MEFHILHGRIDFHRKPTQLWSLGFKVHSPRQAARIFRLLWRRLARKCSGIGIHACALRHSRQPRALQASLAPDDCGIANAIGQLTFPYLVSGPRAAEVLPTMRSSWNFRPQPRQNEAARTADATRACWSRRSLLPFAFTTQNGYSSGRCSTFGMLTTEPCSSLLPVEYRFKFQ
jgi:hypothetical protein